MDAVTISSKFQVVIPKHIRQTLNLVAGQRMQVRLRGCTVELVPEKTVASLRGKWPTLDATVMREKDRV